MLTNIVDKSVDMYKLWITSGNVWVSPRNDGGGGLLEVCGFSNMTPTYLRGKILDHKLPLQTTTRIPPRPHISPLQQRYEKTNGAGRVLIKNPLKRLKLALQENSK